MKTAIREEIELLRKSVRNFIQNEVEQVAMQIEKENLIPKRVVELSKEMGLFGLSIPEAYGGLGLNMVEKCMLYEEIGATHKGTPYIGDSNTEVGQQPIEQYGSELGMGITAENVAKKFHISREIQDVFAFRSQNHAKIPIEKGYFRDEIVPVEKMVKKKRQLLVEDEHPRPNTKLEKLQQLSPVFQQGGTVTAGNACGRNDGAAAVLLMTEEKAKILNLPAIAKVIDWTTVGVDPRVMGIGPVPAIQKLLERTNLSLEEIDLFEINEAFAAQAVAVQRELNIPEEKLNVNGGAIALGHPVGATGTRIVVTLMHELKRRNVKYGIASLCVGGGQGMAILIENIYDK